MKLLDSRFRGNDKNGSKLTFYESIKDIIILFVGICQIHIIYDGLVKTQKDVTSAKAGVQNYLNSLGSRFHGNDDFYDSINFRLLPFLQAFPSPILN